MSDTIDIIETGDADGALANEVETLLGRHAEARGHHFDPVPVCLAVFDRGANPPRSRGGLVGATNFGWLFVKYLAVDEELRGSGIGARLLERAEIIARQRGCVGAWLDTFSFQAPAFYRRMGYAEFGRLDECPPGNARHFFAKWLTDGAAPA